LKKLLSLLLGWWLALKKIKAAGPLAAVAGFSPATSLLLPADEHQKH
jgi:hypothetical protein